MTVPVWILGSFAALMLAVAAVSAARLVVARPWPGADADADIDVSHLLMGIAMAGTLTASLRTLPDTAGEAVFGVLTAWFAYRVVREIRAHGARLLADGHHLPHLVHSAAMLYMFLALAAPRATSGTGMTGMSASSGTMQTLRLPTVALLFAFVLIGFVVSDLDRLSGLPAVRRRPHPSAGFAPAGVALAGAAAVATSTGRPSPAEASLTATPPTETITQATSAHDASSGTARPGVLSSGTTASAQGMRALSGHLLTPGVARGCRVAMGVTMAFMLIIMI